ncbi:hypothetical protein DAI22_08g190300 [Oryza sativa Japonica Group]|nr:hypothetical protein DAI22_08g190300 [Oryza sativa Japonica Group]
MPRTNMAVVHASCPSTLFGDLNLSGISATLYVPPLVATYSGSSYTVSLSCRALFLLTTVCDDAAGSNEAS